jgi:formate-dependent nitrite reductase cytochrome c552 subunit
MRYARGVRMGLLLAVALAVAVCSCGCGPDQPQPMQPPPAAPTGVVTIHIPERLTSVVTEQLDGMGRPLRVACVTCHSQRQPAALPTSTAELDEFHGGLELAHGGLACASCHVLGDQTELHTADGKRLPMRDAIQLCAQCHGTQYRDYQHGAHGGMNGYWDLSRGDRVRNHCIDCHDPHLPAFQPSRPVLPPRDRGIMRHPGTPHGDR